MGQNTDPGKVEHEIRAAPDGTSSIVGAVLERKGSRMSPAHRQSLLFCGRWSHCSRGGLRPCGGICQLPSPSHEIVERVTAPKYHQPMEEHRGQGRHPKR
jgi:hypothetical protein